MKKTSIKIKFLMPLILLSSFSISSNAFAAADKPAPIEVNIESLEITVDTSPFIFEGDSFEELERVDRERLISNNLLDVVIDDVLGDTLGDELESL